MRAAVVRGFRRVVEVLVRVRLGAGVNDASLAEPSS